MPQQPPILEGSTNPRVLHTRILATTRWSTVLARLTTDMEKQGRRLVDQAIKDVTKGGKPFTREERAYLRAALVHELLTYVADAAEHARTTAETLTEQSPALRGVLEVQTHG